MILLSDVLEYDFAPKPPADQRMIIIRPPALRMLPRRRMRPAALLASLGLHAIAATAFLFLARFFPMPVVVSEQDFSSPEAMAINEPLVLPQLPPLNDSAAAAPAQEAAGPAHAAAGEGKSAPALPRVPDYTAPQEIVSELPNPVNRIQTIQRPDLVAPPNLKFPLRLQSVVLLPTPSSPVLAKEAIEAPRPESTQSPSDAQIQPIKQTIEVPVVKLDPKHGSVIRANAAPMKPASPNLKHVTGTQGDALKALVVINAVEVIADPSAVPPPGQLAGKFVVGPSSGPRAGDPTGAEPRAGKGSPSGNPAVAQNSGGDLKVASKDGLSVGAGSANPRPGGAGGAGPRASVKDGTGARAGSPNGGRASGTGVGNGSVSGPVPGISISGGVPGRSSTTAAKALPQRGTYPLMIIGGGGSGGAGRDLGVFGRSETVYSVSIPMGDAGGGSDWTMQYALLNPGQGGTGLLVPPVATKKIIAVMKSSEVLTDLSPVFISAIVDETGKLRALKLLRTQDARSQAAVHALEQWEFMPAQLEGKPVASKILFGVAVVEKE